MCPRPEGGGIVDICAIAPDKTHTLKARGVLLVFRMVRVRETSTVNGPAWREMSRVNSDAAMRVRRWQEDGRKMAVADAARTRKAQLLRQNVDRHDGRLYARSKIRIWLSSASGSGVYTLAEKRRRDVGYAGGENQP